MEIEFTQPVDTALANQISNYNIRTYAYNPTSNYGGSKMTGTLTTLTPSSIQISPDRKRVYLALPGLVARTTSGATAGFGTHRIVELNIKKTFRSAGNAAPRDTIAYYTLNAISPSAPFSDTGTVSLSGTAPRGGPSVTWRVAGDRLLVDAPFRGAYSLRLVDLRGKVLASSHGTTSSATPSFPAVLLRGITMLEARGDGFVSRHMIARP